MIETKRLILRRLKISDHAALDSLLGDAEVMEFSENGTLNSAQVGVWLKDQIEVYKKNNGIEDLVIENKPTSELMGYCGLSIYHDIDGLTEVEIGYRLTRKFWGCGYATEAASAVRDFAFAELNLTRLVALIDPVNIRSIGVARKLGMAYAKEVLMDGYDHPDHLFAMGNRKLQV